MMTRELSVVYILGSPRSGSTILGNILGELPDVFHAGELRFMWERNLVLDKRLCGCGERLWQCPIWSPVLTSLSGAFRGLTGDESSPNRTGLVDVGRQMFQLQRRAAGERNASRILKVASGARGSPDLATYVDVMTHLYQLIGATTAARVIIDSSKWPADGALLHLMPSIRPYFVHLVRDPRGVAYSRLRTLRGGSGVRNATMKKLVLTKDALWWNRANADSESVRVASASAGSTLVRYEDLASDPRRTITTICRLLDLPLAGSASADGGVELHGNHTVGGNRNRRLVGRVQLREDHRWRSGLRWSEGVLVDAMTWSGRRRYGYVDRPVPEQKALRNRVDKADIPSA